MQQKNPAGESRYQTRRRERPRLTPNPKLRLRGQVHEVMRFLHFSERTEETYWQWIVRFLKFHRGKTGTDSGKHPTSNIQHSTSKMVKPTPEPVPQTHSLTRPAATLSHPMGEGQGWRHPREMGAAEVNAFLSHLASELNVAAATQNQALNALVFLYGEVLHQPLGELGEFQRVRRAARVPEVLSRAETQRVLEAVETEYALPLKLLYGSGLRLFELLRLRVKVA